MGIDFKNSQNIHFKIMIKGKKIVIADVWLILIKRCYGKYGHNSVNCGSIFKL